MRDEQLLAPRVLRQELRAQGGQLGDGRRHVRPHVRQVPVQERERHQDQSHRGAQALPARGRGPHQARVRPQGGAALGGGAGSEAQLLRLLDLGRLPRRARRRGGRGVHAGGPGARRKRRRAVASRRARAPLEVRSGGAEAGPSAVEPLLGRHALGREVGRRLRGRGRRGEAVDDLPVVVGRQGQRPLQRLRQRRADARSEHPPRGAEQRGHREAPPGPQRVLGRLRQRKGEDLRGVRRRGAEREIAVAARRLPPQACGLCGGRGLRPAQRQRWRKVPRALRGAGSLRPLPRLRLRAPQHREDASREHRGLGPAASPAAEIGRLVGLV
mmetsp:Transcript_117290/g.328272  ORF Transcript_117290/g.328272 Transcript_117290/m.328272 type:complete len:328 (+) Transcript_117290:713-1696(+)